MGFVVKMNKIDMKGIMIRLDTLHEYWKSQSVHIGQNKKFTLKHMSTIRPLHMSH